MGEKSLSDLTSQCIRCGFCLESCPTFVISGKETESPRGRIYLARSADEGRIGWSEAKHSLETCVGCRACETACPSGVKYGQILEKARERIGGSQALHKFLGGVTSPSKFKAQVSLSRLWPGSRIPGVLAKRLSNEPPEAGLPRAEDGSPWPMMDESGLPEVRGEAYMLEGCAMRVLYPRVNEALKRLLRRVGYAVRDVDAGCCGALHAHNGFLQESHRMAMTLMDAMPEDLPIIVDAAGCGSHLKEFAKPSDRIFDATEFLLAKGLDEALRGSAGVSASATYHDACHLAHGQGVREQPRALLRAVPGLNLVEMEEPDMCCGSGGVYNLTQPGRARRLLERKWANIARTGVDFVVMGNPGCQTWIDQASREQGSKIKVVHTLEMLESSFSGLRA